MMMKSTMAANKIIRGRARGIQQSSARAAEDEKWNGSAIEQPAGSEEGMLT